MRKELKIFAALVIIFLVAYFLPLQNPKIQEAIGESFRLLQWYARNHTLACVVPALFIAGAIITFLSQGSVMRYLGPKANPVLAYGVASVAGCVLAVCSCSVLPMFAGPKAHYEREGDVDDVVFPCGWVRKGETIFMYYGAADSCIGLATAKVNELVEFLLRG